MGGAAGKQATIVEEPLALNYDLTKEELGKGVYATIFKGRCRATGAAVAIKVFHKGHRKYDKEAVNEEAAIMRHLTGRNGGKEGTHHSCVRLLGASQDKSAANLVMELVQGGTLNERINPEEPFSEVASHKTPKHSLHTQTLARNTNTHSPPHIPQLHIFYQRTICVDTPHLLARCEQPRLRCRC